jgi:hypothetical protein
MTDQHRAATEDWEYIRLRAEDGVGLLNCILELRARIESLEAAQLEQAESHRFCTDAIVRRVEALEAPMTELHAASAEARPASPAAQAVLDAWSKGEGGVYLEGDPDRLAAALRAAAEQPYEVPPWYRGDDYWTYRNGVDAERSRLLTLATELETRQ